jgi:glutamine amidotransferase
VRPPTFAVVDYGIGNLGSVMKAFRHLGAPAVLTGEIERLRQADVLVLPGDGAFASTMEEIERRRLVPVLREAVDQGRTLLGICIGMQLFFEESEEHGLHRGLGFLPGRVRRLEGGRPVPHMGWNQLHPTRPHPLLEGIEDGAHVYFVHSYWCDAPAEVVLAETDYGTRFPAMVGRGRVLGVQFHPEKSQGVGLRLMANFVRACVGAASGASATGSPA